MADSRTQTLAALALLMVTSMIIGGIAHKSTQKGGFLSGYFLGNRGLGSWSMALTATVMSGGGLQPQFGYRDLTHPVFLDFAGYRRREFLDEAPVLRHLKGRNLPSAEFHQVVACRLCSRSELQWHGRWTAVVRA